ncbi:MAG: phosphoglycolate phosphatase [Marinobacter sp.]|nr:phosphoglycolate phosphatase [Marinobacter sp.]
MNPANLKALFQGQYPKATLFDLDGTLVDSAADLTIAVDRMLTDLGRPVAGEVMVRQWVGNGASVLVRRALARDFHWQQAAPADDHTFDTALAAFRKHYRLCNGQHSQIYPGVEDFLDALHKAGTRLAVITNKPAEFTQPLLAQLKLDHWFALTLSGDSLPTKKPDPAPLHHAMEKLQSQPHNTLMVGDSVNDILAAQRAGMPAVAVSYGYHFGEPLATLGAQRVVDSLSQLL